MSNIDHWYANAVRRLWVHGERRVGRNGVTRGSFGDSLDIDLREGFPILTIKRMGFLTSLGETLAFLAGINTTAEFRSLGCNFWDGNAGSDYWLANPNRPQGTLEEGPLGRIYGVQWRQWRGLDGSMQVVYIDQLQRLLQGLRDDPFGRRHIVTAWQPAELDQMALAPCHAFFQVHCHSNNDISLQMYQRSADLFLGVPYNITCYSLILHLLAAMTGRRPRMLHMRFGDFHLYEVHETEDKAVTALLAAEAAGLSYARPRFEMDDLDLHQEDFSDKSMAGWAHPQHFRLKGYTHGPSIPARMIE